jgi:hypothetical protein
VVVSLPLSEAAVMPQIAPEQVKYFSLTDRALERQAVKIS